MLQLAAVALLQLGLFPLTACVHLSQNRSTNAVSLPNGLTLHSSAGRQGLTGAGARDGLYPPQAHAHTPSGGLPPVSGGTHVDMPGEHGNTAPYPVVHRQGAGHADGTHADPHGQRVVPSQQPVHSSHSAGTHVDLPGEHGNISPYPVVHRHRNDHVSNNPVSRDFTLQQTNPVTFGFDPREVNVFGAGSATADVVPQLFNSGGLMAALPHTGPGAGVPGMFAGGGAFPPALTTTPLPMVTAPWMTPAMMPMPFPPFGAGFGPRFQGEPFWRLPRHIRRRFRFRRRQRRRMQRRMESMRISLLLNAITHLLANMA